jgi:hypothetical protein
VPYPLTLERIGPDKLLAKETPDQVLENDGAGAVLRDRDAGDALIGVKAQHGDKSVSGASLKSLTPGKIGPGARREDLEAFDVSNARPCHDITPMTTV